MRVTVTQAMIDVGIAGSCRQCPVALGVHHAARANGREGLVVVNQSAIKLYVGDHIEAEWVTPNDVANFIDHFDSRDFIEKSWPFSFVLK